MGTTRLIVAGSMIDGSGSGTAARRQVFLTVEEGIITAIGPAADLPCSADAVIDDLSHCTIVPALVDCSVALARSPAVDLRMRNSEQNDSGAAALLLDRHLSYCHAHGVLGVADSSDPAGLVQRSAAGTGPRLPVIIRSARQYQGRNGMPIDSGQNDFLRIAYSADIDSMDPPSTRFDAEELRCILSHHWEGKKVVVANGPQAVAEVLEIGCDAVEQGYGMGEENLRAMAARQVLWIPSVLRAKNRLDGSASGGDVCCRFSLRFVAPGNPLPGAETYWKSVLAEQLALLRLARSLGVPTAIGTGAGGTGILHGESVVEEIKLFIKAGYSLEEALHCGSEAGARFFGMEGLGALTVGRHATFLVTRGTQQQLPRKLSYLENIYHDGIPSAAYRKNPTKVGGKC
jgi:imidazolonepropionase-like amidohydrolase